MKNYEGGGGVRLYALLEKNARAGGEGLGQSSSAYCLQTVGLESKQ